MEKNILIKALLLTDQIAQKLCDYINIKTCVHFVGQNYVESSSLSVGTFMGGKSVLKLRLPCIPSNLKLCEIF